ncbi:hypothetical protein KJW59_22270, partial [Enterococcus faecium]|nr:hypothetical protein [Enterococcus faecium]
EIVDKYAVMQALEKQHLAKYLTDFPEEEFLENDRILMLPHLGDRLRKLWQTADVWQLKP